MNNKKKTNQVNRPHFRFKRFEHKYTNNASKKI